MKKTGAVIKHRFTAGLVLIIGLLSMVTLWLTGASSVHHLVVDILAGYFLIWTFAVLLSERPIRQLRRWVVFTTVALLMSLLLAETPAVLGIVDYRSVFSTPSSEPWYRPEYVVDRELLWIHRPHHQQAEHGEGNIGEMLCLRPNPQEYLVRYDKNGFRNDADMESADIAVLGDSYVEARMLPNEVLMTSVLSDLQNSPVVNFGVGGYAPQQTLAVAKRYALPLHPNALVWVIVEGNLHQASEYEEKISTIPNKSGSMNVWWLRSFTRNSLWALLRLPQRCTPNAYFERRYGVVQETDGRQRRMYFPGYYEPMTELDRDSLQKTVAVLAEAYALCRERGIRFVVVFSPREYRVYHGLPNLSEVSEEVRHYVLNDLPEVFSKMVSEISPDIGYLDLTEVFREEAAKGIPIFLPDDSHWSPGGNRIVAQALHKIISTHRSE
ncbi:MAG TPA: hypothetical protein VJ692_06990 [Nitrospiraceae bacterium]|nr:hypothetical protein [Nitrospiraceae bacterium]